MFKGIVEAVEFQINSIEAMLGEVVEEAFREAEEKNIDIEENIDIYINAWTEMMDPEGVDIVRNLIWR